MLTSFSFDEGKQHGIPVSCFCSGVLMLKGVTWTCLNTFGKGVALFAVYLVVLLLTVFFPALGRTCRAPSSFTALWRVQAHALANLQ